LVNNILEGTQETLLTSPSTAKVSARIDLVQAVQFIANIWRRVCTKTIHSCFAHHGFRHSDLEMPNKNNSKNGVIFEMHHVRNYEKFLCTDNSVQCYNENGDGKEETVEKTTAKQQTTSEGQKNDKADRTEHERVTDQDDKEFIAELQLYFMQESNGGSPMSAPESCADYIQLQTITRTRQGKLDQLLRH
jgi:hypothetical protein